jgi:hypothetical protein
MAAKRRRKRAKKLSKVDKALGAGIDARIARSRVFARIEEKTARIREMLRQLSAQAAELQKQRDEEE